MWTCCRDYIVLELSLESDRVMVFNILCCAVRCRILRQSALKFLKFCVRLLPCMFTKNQILLEDNKSVICSSKQEFLLVK